MKIGLNRAMPYKAALGVLLCVICIAAQVIIYQPNVTRYQLTGSWAVELNAVYTVTHNDSVVQCIVPSTSTAIPDSLTIPRPRTQATANHRSWTWAHMNSPRAK